MKAHLDISNLTKVYATPRGPATIVRNFNLQIRDGEFVSIIGHSGCGKSTVLMMLAGLTPVTSGALVLAGRELDGPGPDRGVVFQSPALLPWLTALDNVRLGVDQVFPSASRAERREVAEYYLTLVGLGGVMHRRPGELSQGMRQRVGIARAFALKPKILLLDEPFGMLDALTRYELQQVLAAVWRQNRITALMVTHDVDEALFLSDRVVYMTHALPAEVGAIVTVDFPHPRDRQALLEDSAHARLRERLLALLAGPAPRATPPAAPRPPSPPPVSRVLAIK